MLNLYALNMMNENIDCEAGVKLLGIDIDNKLTFHNHNHFHNHSLKEAK